LSDKEWATCYNEYLLIKEIEYKNLETVFTKAIVNAFSKNDE
jgi:hypothetical protein